jgi:hypothetical protein
LHVRLHALLWAWFRFLFVACDWGPEGLLRAPTAPGLQWQSTQTAPSTAPLPLLLNSFSICFFFSQHDPLRLDPCFSRACRYGVPKGLYFSFPVTCTPGSYSIVKGLTVDKFSQEVGSFQQHLAAHLSPTALSSSLVALPSASLTPRRRTSTRPPRNFSRSAMP